MNGDSIHNLSRYPMLNLTIVVCWCSSIIKFFVWPLTTAETELWSVSLCKFMRSCPTQFKGILNRAYRLGVKAIRTTLKGFILLQVRAQRALVTLSSLLIFICRLPTIDWKTKFDRLISHLECWYKKLGHCCVRYAYYWQYFTHIIKKYKKWQGLRLRFFSEWSTIRRAPRRNPRIWISAFAT